MDWAFLTVAAIFLICIIIGIYKGALRIAVSLATTLVTLVIVFFASPYAADAIIKYTPVDEMIQDKVSSAMTDAAAEYLAAGAEDIMEDGISREDVEKALEAAGISEEQLEAYDISIDDIVDGDISSEQLSELGLADKLSGLGGAGDEEAEGDAGSALESMDIPRDLQQEAISEADLPDIFKDLLSVNNNSEIYEELGVETFAQYVGNFLSKLIINIVSFLGIFLIVTIIIRAVIFALDIVEDLPVLGILNRLAGGAVGFACALIIVWVLFIVVTLLYTTVIGKDMYDTVQGNGMLKMLYDCNPIMKMAAKI